MTAQDLYQQSVAPLPKSEQLRLAALILQELSASNAIVDYSEEWTEEDIRDWTAHCQRYANRAYPEPDDETS